MPRDADATRRRILDAATAEFAEFGFAGARIDRIEARAHANKRMIYAYFGKKDVLWDVVIARAIDEIHDAVPFTPDDIPTYGGKMFDFIVENPALLRISIWRQLQRPGPIEAERQMYRSKLEALDRISDTHGLEGKLDGADVLAVVLALSTAFLTAPLALKEHFSKGLAAHRSVVVAALTRLCQV